MQEHLLDAGSLLKPDRRDPYLFSQSIEDMSAMSFRQLVKAIATDSHFLIPVVVFLIGLALLFLLH